MVAHRFERKQGSDVEIDLCFACQGLWFDGFESAQLAPGGVVALFKCIHAERETPREPLADLVFCPRCDEPMQHGMDRVKSGVFNYHRCLQQHGRFTTFAQFMTEKGFVRQLSPAEIESLKQGVGVVRCNSCGAPVDIRRDPACGHCRAPLVVLDPRAVEHALAGYHGTNRASASVDVNALAEALLQGEKDKNRNPVAVLTTPLEDLLLSGLSTIWSNLRR